jgi:predicted phosphodiesterase
MDDFIRPAGSGASLIKYVNGEKLTVRVEGGFIYSHSLRGQPGGAVHELYNRQGNKAVETKGESSAAAPGPSAALELAVKLLGPDAKITVDSAAELRTTVRLMNIDPTAAAVRLDGRLLRPRPDPAMRAASDRGTWVPPNPRGTSFITDTRGYRLSFQAGDGLRRTLSVDSIEGGGREFRFAVASDTHSGFTTSLPALRAITEHGCDFMFMNGDFTNNGYPIEYTLNAAFFESMPLPVYTSVGNHDRWDGAQSAEHYAAYFGPDYYSFDYGSTKFIVLDTSMGTTGMEQIEWLEAVLQRNDRRHTVIVSHIPPVDTVKGGFDDSAVLHPELRHSVYSSTESNRLMELFRRHAVDYWVAGHNHVYGEFRTAGGTVVTGGVMGGSRVEGDTPGYLLFRVHGEEIGHDFVPITTFADEHPLPGAKAVESASVFLSPILINHSFRIVLTYLLGFVLLFFLPVWKRRWIKWERDGGKPA